MKYYSSGATSAPLFLLWETLMIICLFYNDQMIYEIFIHQTWFMTEYWTIYKYIWGLKIFYANIYSICKQIDIDT